MLATKAHSESVSQGLTDCSRPNHGFLAACTEEYRVSDNVNSCMSKLLTVHEFPALVTVVILIRATVVIPAVRCVS